MCAIEHRQWQDETKTVHMGLGVGCHALMVQFS